MGVDQSFYFGPYVECVYEPVPVIDTAYRCAQDAKHTVSSGDKFCRSCGAGVKATHVKTDRVKSNINWDALNKEVNDRLYEASSMCGNFGEPNTDYWLSNVRDGITRHTNLGKYEEDAQEITPELIRAEIAVMEKFFAKEIEALRKHYKSARVTWGVLSYCH
jgi:hypothetical protein